MKINKVDALVAAYNEEKTIVSVIKVLQETPEINKIIIVDDGSLDTTFQVVESTKSKQIILLKMPKNGGKSQAIAYGLKRVVTKNIFLCDADLIKLTPNICTSIIKPVLNGQTNMSIGQRNYGPIINFIVKFTPSISGERAMQTSILRQCVKSKYFYNYGMETVINYYFTISKLKTTKKVFDYSHISHLTKKSIIRGLYIYLKQVLLILKIYFIFFIKGWH